MKFETVWTVALQASNEKYPDTPTTPDGNAGSMQAGMPAFLYKLYQQTPPDCCNA
jgi:hypothetical protein